MLNLVENDQLIDSNFVNVFYHYFDIISLSEKDVALHLNNSYFGSSEMLTLASAQVSEKLKFDI